MRLSDYLSDRKLTVEAFGQRIGRSGATVSRIARGLNRPDSETMAAILEATAGKVTPNDFFNIEAAE